MTFFNRISLAEFTNNLSYFQALPDAGLSLVLSLSLISTFLLLQPLFFCISYRLGCSTRFSLPVILSPIHTSLQRVGQSLTCATGTPISTWHDWRTLTGLTHHFIIWFILFFMLHSISEALCASIFSLTVHAPPFLFIPSFLHVFLHTLCLHFHSHGVHSQRT